MASTTKTYYEVPLTATSQTFSISLVGVKYFLSVIWRDAVEGGWMLDIMDQNKTPLVCGISLVTGVNLLMQYEYLGIGGGLMVTTDGDPTAVPTYDNLGNTSHLWFVVIG